MLKRSKVFKRSPIQCHGLSVEMLINISVVILLNINVVSLTSSSLEHFDTSKSRPKMNEFEKFNITLVQGKRNSYVVLSEGGKNTVLKTRSDVVIFLNQNKDINLTPSDFVFKRSYEEPPNVSNETVSVDDSVDVSNSSTDEVSEQGYKRSNTSEGVSAKIRRVSGTSFVEHDDKFRSLLKRVHEIRQSNAHLPRDLSATSISHLKSILTDLTVEDDPVSLAKEILKCPELYSALQIVFRTKMETEIELCSVSDLVTPATMAFPPSCDSNLYCAIIEETLNKMPHFMSFLVNILDSNEQKIMPSYLIKLATIISEILNSKAVFIKSLLPIKHNIC